MPIAEAQSQWVADLIEGRSILPPELEMNEEIATYFAAIARRHRRAMRSARCAIQVDFQSYLRQIRRERRAGAMRHGTLTKSAPRVEIEVLPTLYG